MQCEGIRIDGSRCEFRAKKGVNVIRVDTARYTLCPYCASEVKNRKTKVAWANEQEERWAEAKIRQELRGY
jgi:hypothetical protein